jgi:outer membrane protein TolC
VRSAPRIAIATLALVAAAGPPAAAAPLRLADVVAMAAGKSPAVQVAELRTDEAHSRWVQARGPLLPGLTGSASMVDHTFSLQALGITFANAPGAPQQPNLVGPFDVVDARLRATQTLLDLSSLKHMHAAGEGEKIADAERDQSAEGAAQTAALAYLRAARARAAADARRADLGIASELLTLAQDQRRAGVSPGIDVTRAESQVVSARSQLVVAENLLERGRIDLARALGIDPGAHFELADTLDAGLGASQAPEDSSAALALAHERRPDLIAERMRLQRARTERSAIAAERLPRLDAAADIGLSNDTWDGAPTTRSVGLALTMPILDGLRREGRIDEQRAAINEAEVQGRDLEQQVAADVRGALLDLGSGLELRQEAVDRLRLAEEELAQARERFTSGVANNIEVINAQSSLVRARDADIEARYVIAAARVSLAHAAGVCQTVH